MVVKNRFGIPFWLVGEFTTHFRTDFSRDWDAHWGYDLDFDPWPLGLGVRKPPPTIPWVWRADPVFPAMM